MAIKPSIRPNPFRHACKCTTCTSYKTYNASMRRQLAKRGTPQLQITTAIKINPRFFLSYAVERMEFTGGRLICALLWWVFVGQKPVTGTLIARMPKVCVEHKPEVPLNSGHTIRLIDPDSNERE